VELTNSQYSKIVRTVDVQLQRIVPKWVKEKEYALTFACANNECKDEPIHFYTDEELMFKLKQSVTCSKSRKFDLTESHLMWLEELESGKHDHVSPEAG